MTRHEGVRRYLRSYSHENHPEIPPLIYANLSAPAVTYAEGEEDAWSRLAAWRRVLEIDYAEQRALRECESIARELAASA